jgi:hypothetical protein
VDSLDQVRAELVAQLDDVDIDRAGAGALAPLPLQRRQQLAPVYHPARVRCEDSEDRELGSGERNVAALDDSDAAPWLQPQARRTAAPGTSHACGRRLRRAQQFGDRVDEGARAERAGQPAPRALQPVAQATRPPPLTVQQEDDGHGSAACQGTADGDHVEGRHRQVDDEHVRLPAGQRGERRGRGADNLDGKAGAGQVPAGHLAHLRLVVSEQDARAKRLHSLPAKERPWDQRRR